MTIPADAASDEQLIARTRDGDMGAYDELYRRHVDEASKVARIVTDNSDEAQDVVAEAFTRVLTRLREGGGPDLEFAPYLKTVVRRLAIDRHRSSQRDGSPSDPSILDILPHTDDPMARSTDRQLVRHAFETLPARWQQVLWHTEIEGRSPASLAPALGSSANAVAALAYRAREGLRQAYLAVNLSAEVLPECRPYAPKIASYVRGTLSAHDTREMSAHLATCGPCRERRDELLLLVSDMRGILGPALLLPVSGAGTAVLSGAGAAGGVLAFLSPTRWGTRARQLAVAGGAVAAAAAIAAAAYLAFGGDDSADPPAAAPEASSEPEPPADEPANNPVPPLPAPPADQDEPPADPDQALPGDQPPEGPGAEPPGPGAEPPGQDQPGGDQPPADVPDEQPEPPADPPVAEPTAEPTSEPTPEPTSEPTPQPPPGEPPVNEQAPTIDQQPPANPVVVAGEPVTLTVGVSGNPPPELQWQYADPVGAATGASTATSTAATTVPAAAELPASRFRFASERGAAVRTAAGPASEPAAPSTTWIDIDGATSESLVISDATKDMDGRAYRVTATNPLGSIATDPAVISVQYPPDVLVHPEDVTVAVGGTAAFQATAEANPDTMTISWQARPPGGAWTEPSSAVATVTQDGASSTLELTDVGTELAGYRYRAVFANAIGETRSDAATLTVQWPPEITQQPQDVEASPGGNAELTATASPGNPEAQWVWQRRAPTGGGWTTVAKGTGGEATLSLTGVSLGDDGARYRAVFSNDAGSATTDSARLTVVRAGRFQVEMGSHGTRCLVLGSDGRPAAGDCSGAPERGWLVPGNGTTIVWRETGECLDVALPLTPLGQQQYRSAIVLAPCDGSSSQRWQFDADSTGPQHIASALNQVTAHPHVFDIEGSSATGRLILYPQHGGVNQLFRFLQP